VQSQHLQIEAMKLAFADTYRWVADERFMTDVTAADLLSDAYLSERARLLHLYAAWAFAVMFGGSIIANTLTRLLGLIV